MTVSTTTNKARFTGNGSTTSFPASIKIFNETDIIVTTIVSATNTLDDTLILNDGGALGYTVSFDTEAETLTVTTNTAPSGTQDLQILRDLPLTQTTDFPRATKFPAKSSENAHDKNTMILQDQQEELDRAIKVPAEDPNAITFATYSADKLLAWSNVTTNLVVNSTKTLTDVEGAVDAVAALTAESGVKVSSDDTTVGFLDGKLIAGTGITFTVNNPGGSETMTVDASAASVPIDTVFGRTGDVVAVSGDYDASQVDNDSGVTGATVADALDTLDAGATGRLIDVQTFTSSGTWTKPAGTTSAKVTVVAGGGGGYGNSTNGSSGGASSFGAHCSASGGGGGTSTAAGASGVGSGGDLNISGGNASSVAGSPGGNSSLSGSTPRGGSGFTFSYGAGGFGADTGAPGSGGGTSIKHITSGLGSSETVTVGSIGSRGGGGDTDEASPGGPGVVIVESYT